MHRAIRNILAQREKVILLYGISTFFTLIGIVWYFSFEWIQILHVPFSVIMLFGVLFFSFLVSLHWDKTKNKNTKIFYATPLIQLLIITIIAIPITNWQIESSKSKADDIILQLEEYEDNYHVYPKSLNELENISNERIPKRTNIGTSYQYSTDSLGYYISFCSYHGQIAIYNSKEKKWKFVD